MTKQEISQALKLLAGRTDRTETIIDGAGQSLTAYWIDGGQKMFVTLYAVEQFIAEKQRVAAARSAIKGGANPSMSATPWPKHPDGRPKKMGEMTRDEQRTQMREACERLKPVFESPEMRAAIEAEPGQ